MKRILISILFFASLTMSAQAENISEIKARTVAANFFGNTKSTSGLTLINRADIVSTRSGEEAPYYIYNYWNGGFIIIAGVDASEPVLAYSRKGSFSLADDMPDGLRDWLRGCKDGAAEVRTKNIAPTAEQVSRWDEVLGKTPMKAAPETVVDLKTPIWGQGSPWNLQCPEYNNTHVKVGCVAIAISQVMCYHAHRAQTAGLPECGTGTIGNYTSKKYDSNTGDTAKFSIPKITLDGNGYDWDNMLDTYTSGSYTSTQAAAAAKLCYHVAVMAQMSFSTSGSGASTKTAVNELVDHMKYDQSHVYYSRDYFSDNDWIDLLEDEFDNGRPVIMSAYTASAGAGHAFVLEGYDRNDRILINWGWSGSSNGAFKINSFSSYTRSQMAHLNVMPNAGGLYEGKLAIEQATVSGRKYTGITFKGGNIYPDSTFYVSVGRIKNDGSDTFYGSWGLTLMNKYGVLKQKLKSWSFTSGLTTTATPKDSIDLVLGSNITIEEGDYVQFSYHTSNNTEWLPGFYKLNPADSVFGKMPCYVKDYASMTYGQYTKYLTFKFFPSKWSSCTIYDSKGMEYNKGVVSYSPTAGALVLNTSQMDPDTYSLVMQFSGKIQNSIRTYAQTDTVKFIIKGGK